MPDSSCPRRRIDPVARDRVFTFAGLLIVGGLLIFLLLTQAGCQSHTKVTPASSEAVRTTSDDRGYTEWEVIVTPKEAAK